MTKRPSPPSSPSWARDSGVVPACPSPIPVKLADSFGSRRADEHLKERWRSVQFKAQNGGCGTWSELQRFPSQDVEKAGFHAFRRFRTAKVKTHYDQAAAAYPDDYEKPGTSLDSMARVLDRNN